MQDGDLTWSSALLIPGVHTAKRRAKHQGREWCGVSADPQGWAAGQKPMVGQAEVAAA